jgi:hypothetical protein
MPWEPANRGMFRRIFNEGTYSIDIFEAGGISGMDRVRMRPNFVGVDVFSVGFDVPEVDLVAMLRPTMSTVMSRSTSL